MCADYTSYLLLYAHGSSTWPRRRRLDGHFKLYVYIIIDVYNNIMYL